MVDASNGDEEGGIRFDTTLGGNTGVEAMRIVGGKVGIGTSFPSSSLDVAGGIIEQGGVLKENLLTNSGFDVWSNSTLETVATTHSEGFESNAGLWTGNFNTSEATSTDEANSGSNSLKCTNTGGGWGLTYQSSAITVVIGKLYKVSVYAHNGNSGSTRVTAGSASATGTDIFESGTVTTGGWSEHTFVFEATTTALWIVLGTYDNSAPYNLYNYYDDIIVTEVTPGCVATDVLAMDTWARNHSSLDLYREHNGTKTKDGSFYSLKLVKGADDPESVKWPHGDVQAEETHVLRFRGRTVTFGAWVYSVSATDNIRLCINDGDNATSNTAYAGADAWEWLEVTQTISSSNVFARFWFECDGDSADVAYVSQPMLVFGSSIGEGNYTRPQGEIVWFEDYLQLTDYDGTTTVSSNTGAINIEAQSNGVIPKGVKAVNVSLVATSDGAAESIYTYDGSNTDLRGTWALTQIANGYVSSTGFQQCDANGDFGIGIDATFTGVRLRCTGVQLR
jgi:hypothetical protein